MSEKLKSGRALEKDKMRNWKAMQCYSAWILAAVWSFWISVRNSHLIALEKLALIKNDLFGILDVTQLARLESRLEAFKSINPKGEIKNFVNSCWSDCIKLLSDESNEYLMSYDFYVLVMQWIPLLSLLIIAYIWRQSNFEKPF